MSKRIYVELSIEGFEVPVFMYVEIEGFVDPIIALEKMGVFNKSLSGKVKIKGLESKALNIRTEPGR